VDAWIWAIFGHCSCGDHCPQKWNVSQLDALLQVEIDFEQAKHIFDSVNQDYQ
jgi:hypothetical protein